MSSTEPPWLVVSLGGASDDRLVSDLFTVDPAAVGKRIEQAREAAGFTNASEFARLIGVQPNSVYRYERGEQNVQAQVLYRIARLTRRSMEWLIAGRSVSAAGALARWLQTPTGSTATPDEIAWLERLDLEGCEPTDTFFDLALSAKRHGLTHADAVKAAIADQVANT